MSRSASRIGPRTLVATVAAIACAAALAGPASAAFPGLNGKIAVSRNDQIVVKAPGDLTGGTALTSLGQNEDPEWSPDGTRIAFVSNRTAGVFQVWLMNADGSGQSQLTQESVDASAPSWSPDGTHLAYTITGADEDVAVIATTGAGRLLVASGSGDQGLPVWTPDGSRVIFNDTTVNGLSSVGATGAGRAQFLSDADQPDFSPDGTRIIVRRTNIQRLQIVSADGSGSIPVLESQPGTRPVWSPDGTRILYHRFVGGGDTRLFTVASAGGGVEVPESSTSGTDFSPDWQAIGPVPAISGLPTALVAGAPGATLTIDGSGFVRRSVVRWNGAARPTTFVSGTRLQAALTAADVASPGSAQVTVFTSPSGGGVSGAATAKIPAPPGPPPRILVSKARLRGVTWTRSRVRGTLQVTGSLERAGRIEIALVRGTRAAQTKVLALPAGPFSQRLALARTLVPGRYTLRVREVGTPAGPALVTATRLFTLPAPAEGVVLTSFVSALLNGPPARTLRGKSRIFAQFRFATLPKRGRRITTTWFRPGGAAVNTDGKPRTRLVTSFVALSSGLPPGTWRCELRVGGRLVSVAAVRLRP